MITDSRTSDGADLPMPRGRLLLGPRFSPGPLRAVKRSGPSGAAKGAVVGGLVGLAVLAAFSLPLVLAQVDTRSSLREHQGQAEAPRPVQARSAAIPAPKSAPAETASIASPPAYEPPAAPAPKTDSRASSRSALSLDSLPTLTQDAADIDLDPVSAAPPPPPPRQPQKPVAARRSAPPKP